MFDLNFIFYIFDEFEHLYSKSSDRLIVIWDDVLVQSIFKYSREMKKNYINQSMSHIDKLDDAGSTGNCLLYQTKNFNFEANFFRAFFFRD